MNGLPLLLGHDAPRIVPNPSEPLEPGRCPAGGPHLVHPAARREAFCARCGHAVPVRTIGLP